MADEMSLKIKKGHTNVITICIFCVLLGVCLFFYLISWEKLISFPSICIWKNIFGHECLACGSIRAFWLLLHLKFVEAFRINPLIYLYIPLIILIIYKYIIRQFRIKTGLEYQEAAKIFSKIKHK